MSSFTFVRDLLTYIALDTNVKSIHFVYIASKLMENCKLVIMNASLKKRATHVDKQNSINQAGSIDLIEFATPAV